MRVKSKCSRGLERKREWMERSGEQQQQQQQLQQQQGLSQQSTLAQPAATTVIQSSPVMSLSVPSRSAWSMQGSTAQPTETRRAMPTAFSLASSPPSQLPPIVSPPTQGSAPYSSPPGFTGSHNTFSSGFNGRVTHQPYSTARHAAASASLGNTNNGGPLAASPMSTRPSTAQSLPPGLGLGLGLGASASSSSEALSSFEKIRSEWNWPDRRSQQQDAQSSQMPQQQQQQPQQQWADPQFRTTSSLPWTLSDSLWGPASAAPASSSSGAFGPSSSSSFGPPVSSSSGSASGFGSLSAGPSFGSASSSLPPFGSAASSGPSGFGSVPAASGYGPMTSGFGSLSAQSSASGFGSAGPSSSFGTTASQQGGPTSGFGSAAASGFGSLSVQGPGSGLPSVSGLGSGFSASSSAISSPMGVGSFGGATRSPSSSVYSTDTTGWPLPMSNNPAPAWSDPWPTQPRSPPSSLPASVRPGQAAPFGSMFSNSSYSSPPEVFGGGFDANPSSFSFSNPPGQLDQGVSTRTQGPRQVRAQSGIELLPDDSLLAIELLGSVFSPSHDE
eukprot:m.93216 g.93216  ORF g.93216 m.93216 type:complete len:557 (+) comp13797_c1_seq7:296-1966(+)